MKRFFAAGLVVLSVTLALATRSRASYSPSFAPCGPVKQCEVHTTYCEIVLSDVADPPTDYACKPLPTSCVRDDGGTPTCACFPKDTRCLSFCGPIDTAIGPRGIHLTCRL